MSAEEPKTPPRQIELLQGPVEAIIDEQEVEKNVNQYKTIFQKQSLEKTVVC